MLLEALPTLWAQFSGDCRRVPGGMQFGVVQVLFWVAVGGAADRVGLFPRKLETIGVLTSNEEGELFCKIGGWELGGGAGAVLGAVRLRCW